MNNDVNVHAKKSKKQKHKILLEVHVAGFFPCGAQKAGKERGGVHNNAQGPCQVKSVTSQFFFLLLLYFRNFHRYKLRDQRRYRRHGLQLEWHRVDQTRIQIQVTRLFTFNRTLSRQHLYSTRPGNSQQQLLTAAPGPRTRQKKIFLKKCPNDARPFVTSR